MRGAATTKGQNGYGTMREKGGGEVGGRTGKGEMGVTYHCLGDIKYRCFRRI